MSRRVIQAEGIPLLDECLWVLAMDLWGLLRAPQSPKLYVSWLRLTDHVWNIVPSIVRETAPASSYSTHLPF